MNTALIFSIALILAISLLLFWLFYRNSNSTRKLSEKYLLENLSGQDLTSEQRAHKEQQLSLLLQKKQTSSANRMLIFVAIAVIPASLILYKMLGNPKAVNYVKNTSQSSQQVNTQQGQEPQLSMEEALKQLEQKLSENPDDIDGQVLYARTLFSMQDYEKSVKVYRNANVMAPNEPVLLTEMAEAIALFNNNRSFLGEPEELLKKAVEIDNTNQKALWLYGMTFYEKQNFEKTNELWTSLYDLMDNENAKSQLFEQITEVRTKLGIDIQPNANTVAEEPASDILQLKVNIKYDNDALPPQEIKRATLYLYTKAATGVPMPIAVVRKPIEVITNSFPMNLTLSDLNNLQPTRKLSDFDSVVIGARISYTGNAIAQPGDMQSTEIKIDLPYSGVIELTIDKIKK